MLKDRLVHCSSSVPAFQRHLLAGRGSVYHEMGHALGLDDDYSDPDSDGIMNGWLPTGTRRLPTVDELEYMAGK